MVVERGVGMSGALGNRSFSSNDISSPYAKLGRLIAVLHREREEGTKTDGNSLLTVICEFCKLTFCTANEEIQEDISTLNTRRHLLTLSIRNLDRKINFLIKSRKHKEEATEMEEEEVYQFFDQTTSEENPLGQNKEVHHFPLNIIFYTLY